MPVKIKFGRRTKGFKKDKAALRLFWGKNGPEKQKGHGAAFAALRAAWAALRRRPGQSLGSAKRRPMAFLLLRPLALKAQGQRFSAGRFIRQAWFLYFCLP